MLTRCPNCGTAFRVTPLQIKARAGTVRCGQCHFVFNALDTLEDTEAVAPEPAETMRDDAEPADIVPAHDIEFDVGETTEPFVGDIDIPVEPSPEPDWSDDDTDDERDQAIEPVTEPPYDYLSAPVLTDTVTPTRNWPWIVGSALAVMVLLLQMAYYYRIELAAMRPEWRPVLMSMCAALHCTVPRPRQIDAISIDSSDLRPDALRPGHLMLSATLRSKSALAQEWPTLELTLTDVADRRLAVRHFTATDYLPANQSRATLVNNGFPPNGEIPVTLALDIDGLQAAGYRLYVFYP